MIINVSGRAYDHILTPNQGKECLKFPEMSAFNFITAAGSPIMVAQNVYYFQNYLGFSHENLTGYGQHLCAPAYLSS